MSYKEQVRQQPIVKRMQSIVRSADPTAHLILYGSRARGDFRADSDWDILVLLDKEAITIDDDRDITMPLKMVGYDFGQEVNPQLFTLKEWNRYAATPFNHNVLRDRIRIS